MSDRWVAFLNHELQGIDRLLVLGTGNALKADDAAGLLVASLLDRRLSRRQKARVKVLRVYELIDAYNRRLKRLKPSHLIIVDAFDSGRQPGFILATRLETGRRKKKKISSEFYTLLEKLSADSACRIYFLGIQPALLDFGHPISAPVKEACRKVADYIATLASDRPR
ncbi:MAG: hydrogenase maturation protease [Candidatus Saccharicenans sp.]|nr:hydrogenase maturation protease [Candidatus Saccharicenans sp.]MDI6848265.1 hydrogenase maturation protease [Candidatus Saccharicenans sp.]